MKIIIATPIYPPEIGGPATYIKELCSRISDTNDITIITYTNSKEALPKTQLVPVSKNLPLPIRLVLFFIKTLLDSREADVIYVQNAMAAGLPVALVSMITGTPFVLKFVGDEAWERATQRKLTTKLLQDFMAEPEGGTRISLMMLVQGFVLRRASIVTTPSLYLGEALIRTYGVEREQVVVNYNAGDNTGVMSSAPVRITHQIATTARLVKWKGIDGIIRALAMLKNKFPDTRLVIAGDGPERENLENLARDCGVADSVKFLGNVSREETWRLRTSSEVYVLNSSYEGLPHTALTSFSSKIPMVATDIPGTNEAVYDEKTGLLVEAGNDIALVNAVERLFTDKVLAKRLVDGGTKILKEKFSWEAHLNTLNNIFKSVVS